MSVKKPPPGPGWKPKLVLEAPGQSSTRYCHWISPVRKIEFTRWVQACEFEQLRKKHGNNEVEAWAAYRQSNVGAEVRVVSPYLHDAKPNKTSAIQRKVKEEEGSSTATSTNRKKRKMTSDNRVPTNKSKTNTLDDSDMVVTKSKKQRLASQDSEECYICYDGGELILCDYCPKAFHLECHIPRLYVVPDGKWRCCECSATTRRKKQRCGECEDCLKPDCGECTPCLNKECFGGDGSYGKACKYRQCKYMRVSSL